MFRVCIEDLASKVVIRPSLADPGRDALCIDPVTFTYSLDVTDLFLRDRFQKRCWEDPVREQSRHVEQDVVVGERRSKWTEAVVDVTTGVRIELFWEPLEIIAVESFDLGLEVFAKDAGMQLLAPIRVGRKHDHLG